MNEAARRYREGHGPATVDDFAFWLGCGKREAARALAATGELETKVAPMPSALLLPGYDEYLLGYRERSACLAPEHFERVVPGGNGVFLPVVAVEGAAVATSRVPELTMACEDPRLRSY